MFDVGESSALVDKCNVALAGAGVTAALDKLLNREGGESKLSLYLFTADGLVSHCWPSFKTSDLGQRKGFIVHRCIHMARLQAMAIPIPFDPDGIVRVVIGRIREYDLMFDVLGS